VRSSVNRRDYVNGLAVAATVLLEFVSARPSNATVQSPLPSARLDVDWPAPTVAISSSWRLSANEHHLIRRHIHGGARDDLVSFATGDGASGAIEISRSGAESNGFTDPTTAVAARTIDLGLAGPPLDVGMLETKFGPVALVDFALKAPAKQRQCLGFQRVYAEPRLEMVGWYCNTGPEVVDRGALVCLLDRLKFLQTGTDDKVAEIFTNRPLNRTRCIRRGATLAINAKDYTLRGAIAAVRATPPTPRPHTTLKPLDLIGAVPLKTPRAHLRFLVAQPNGLGRPASRAGLGDSKRMHGLAAHNSRDADADRLVNVQKLPKGTASFVGGWASDVAQCHRDEANGAPISISLDRAESDGGACAFQSIRREGTGWSIRAHCAAGGEAWDANVTLALSGEQLTWSSERGLAIYHRCQSGEISSRARQRD